METVSLVCPVQSDFGAIPKGQQLGELIRLLRRLYHRKPGAPQSEPARPLPSVHFEGTTPDGDLLVVISDAAASYRLAIEGEWVLRRLAGPLLDAPRELDLTQLPYRPRTSTLLPIHAGRAKAGKPTSRILAGPTAQRVSSVEALSGNRLAVAAYTTRGPTHEGQGITYKDYNEDAVVIRLRKATSDGVEIAALGAFDQAGGEGSVVGSPGAASELVANLFEEAVGQIEAGEIPSGSFTTRSRTPGTPSGGSRWAR